jgi:tetrahydromethanopterin S-methyltransferase subunit G
MAETVRYKAGDAIRWLDMGSDSLKDSAKRQTRDVVERKGERSIGKDIGGLFGAVVDLGKGAVADLLHRQADSNEYVLDDTTLEIRNGRGVKRIGYDQVKSIRRNNDKVKLILAQGSVEIKPYAHIVAGRIKVPVGWVRNGVEVPYDLLSVELAARVGVEIEDE